LVSEDARKSPAHAGLLYCPTLSKASLDKEKVKNKKVINTLFYDRKKEW
jgi:hypothetical protein